MAGEDVDEETVLPPKFYAYVLECSKKEAGTLRAGEVGSSLGPLELARLGAGMCRGRARGIGPLKDDEAPSSMGKVSRVVDEEEVTSPPLL